MVRAKKFEKDNFEVSVDGVYLIGYRDTRTDERYIVYVGQGEIGTRLKEHYRNNSSVEEKTNQPGRIGYYRYAPCADENDRLDIELGLYYKHGRAKLCNEVEPPGSGRYEEIEVKETFT